MNGFNPAVVAEIDTVAKTIKIKLPPGTDPTILSPTITVSDKASITPASGTALNLTNYQTYTVIAEDSTKVNYIASLIRPTVSVKDVPTLPKYLCIYYGFPSLVNGSNGNLNNAVNAFKNFDIIVFADALREVSHPDHNNTVSIISMLKAQKPTIKIYGYIDIGVFATGQPWIHNYSEAQLIQYINDWKGMGATGVFGDDFGYDYQVTRARQNVFINEAHSKGLSVFANSWSINDALAGTDCKLDSTDFYLMESFLVANGTYKPLQANIDKANLAYYYMKNKKIGIACVARPQTISAASNFTDQYRMCWNATAMFNFDAFQFTDVNQSASNNVLFYFAIPQSLTVVVGPILIG